MKSNAEYWEKRILRDKKKAISDEKIIQKQLNKIYKDTFKELEKDIMTLFQRYANDNGLTYSDAIKYLTSKEFYEWRMDLSEYIELIEKTSDEKLLLELNTLAMKSRISRLEQLTYQVNKQLNKCFTYSNDIVKELLEKSVVNAYSDSAKNVNYAYGMEATKSIAKERVTKILMEPWSGANFSESIWSNRDKLAGVVRNELTKGIYQGKSSRNICNEISKRMEGSKDDIMRVVRTERSHAVNKAKLEQYKDTGFEYYKYKAAIGQSRTCERCRKIHKESEEKPIKLSEAVEGENFPPLHPNCRCTVVPFMSNTIISKEDKEDFEKFKSVGIGIPDDIEDFVKIKYNDNKEAWEDLQMKYERKTEYNLQIRQGKQNHHIKGRNGYTNKSYLLEGIDAKELVDNFGGKGKLKRTTAGELTDKEFCEVDFIIGVVVDQETGEETETNRFSISYSKKKGTHVVPRNKEKGEKND